MLLDLDYTAVNLETCPFAQIPKDVWNEPSRAFTCPQEGRGVFPLLPRLAQQHVADRTDLKMN